jgi:ATP-dependent protease Clp ATPase subunit
MRGDLNHTEVNRNTQSNILKWLDPDTYMELQSGMGSKYKVSTAQMTFIFSGAFEGLFEAKQLDSKEMGFNADVKSYDPMRMYEHKIGWEEIKKYGLMPELVNRFNVLIQTQPYTKRQLNKISKKSYDRAFIEQMLDVSINDKKLIEDSIKDRSGARGLKKSMYGQALDKYKLKGKEVLK